MNHDDETPEETAAAEETAVTWLLRLRQLQRDGMAFDDALKVANSEFPEG